VVVSIIIKMAPTFTFLLVTMVVIATSVGSVPLPGDHPITDGTGGIGPIMMKKMTTGNEQPKAVAGGAMKPMRQAILGEDGRCQHDQIDLSDGCSEYCMETLGVNHGFCGPVGLCVCRG